VTLDSGGRFVFVANYLSSDIWAYAVQTGSGNLVPITGSPFAAGLEPYSVTVDPLNRFAYAANNGGNVSAYAVDGATGASTQITGSPFAVGDWSIPVAVDPSGRFAYAGGGSDGTYDTPGYVAIQSMLDVTIARSLIDLDLGEGKAQSCANAFREKAGRSQVGSRCFSLDAMFFLPSRHYRHPSIRTLW
jgi:Lactonase, 7-bladed beta-propeller